MPAGRIGLLQTLQNSVNAFFSLSCVGGRQTDGGGEKGRRKKGKKGGKKGKRGEGKKAKKEKEAGPPISIMHLLGMNPGTIFLKED